eukprot:NODE_22170_length_719_cov_5.347973.p4 GENE.NODE_22170_length_719_cov_5.347973~~NODE_22170_length_719_cov_5.347973.p4  ORF type:complete len:76 (-),score=6.38 NODE_22170_length_719_cov_5.347973:211-438(-)
MCDAAEKGAAISSTLFMDIWAIAGSHIAHSVRRQTRQTIRMPSAIMAGSLWELRVKEVMSTEAAWWRSKGWCRHS